MYHQITSRKIHGTVTTGSWLGKVLLLVLVSAVVILLVPNLSLAQNATLTDDTHTNANKPNKNFGAAVSVVVREPDERGLLKFKLTPNLPPGTTGSHVGKATLKLFVAAVGAPGQINVQRVMSAWTEQSVTDATFPALGLLEGTVSINAGGDGKWVTLDVTQLVKDWLDGVLPNNGVSLVAAAGTDAIFDSKENTGTSHEPRLEIVLNHAATADTASNAAQLGGVDAAQFIKGTDPRLTDSRPPTAGSANYIQNTTTPQAGANFNVSGNGTLAGNLTVGGSLSLNIVNAQTQYNLGGQRVISAEGTGNLFVGAGAGKLNTTGDLNSYFGTDAGRNNTSGRRNAFFGESAGVSNTTGVDNAFFGEISGASNTTGGDNSFFGEGAGSANTTGSVNAFFGTHSGTSNTTGFANTFIGQVSGKGNTTGRSNTLLGEAADVGANNLSNATAIGASAQVAQSNSLVLGSINGTNGATTDTNVGIGTTTPAFRLTVKTAANNYGFIHTDDSGVEVGTWTGSGSAGSPGGWLGTNSSHPLRFFTANGPARLTIGVDGNVQIPGQLTVNTFDVTTQYNIGGQRILTNAGTRNLFAGVGTGTSNTNGFQNAFVGFQAGNANTTGHNNSFFGQVAGENNTEGFFNSFFGSGAGVVNTKGSNNSYFGLEAGRNNATGSNNSFFGFVAGKNNTVSGNSFFGSRAGESNTVGDQNAFFGSSAGVTNTVGAQDTFVGASAGFSNTTGNLNAFVGAYAGLFNTTGGHNSFFGWGAGEFNQDGNFNSFFGRFAGGANRASYNDFFGVGSGENNTTGANNSFFGHGTGRVNVTGGNNTIVGNLADFGTGGLKFATAIGSYAVVNANDTIVLGKVAGTYNGVARPADTVQIPGNLNVVGTLTGSFSGDGSGLTNLNASNISTGTLDNARLGLIPTANIADSAVTAPKIATGQVVKNLNGLTDNVTLAAGSNVTITPSGNTLTIAATGGGGSAILNQTTQQTGANFNIDGTGKASVFDAATQFNIGGQRILTMAQGDSDVSNLFVGFGAGTSFTGQVSGNTFVGAAAGASDTIGGFNSFFGYQAGLQNTTGGENSFFGFNSGVANVDAFSNSFFGYQSGRGNSSGRNNSFFGHNTGSVSGADNNSFFGGEAGLANRTGASNTLIGANTDVGADNLTNATAIGANAVVSQSNALILGNNASVGIGTSTPKAKLDVTGGNILVGSPGQGIILKSPNGATCRLLSIDNTGAMVLSAITCP